MKFHTSVFLYFQNPDIFFRPTEEECIQGDASKARKKLGLKPEIGFDELVSLMVREDLQEAERDHLCQRGGFKVYHHYE